MAWDGHACERNSEMTERKADAKAKLDVLVAGAGYEIGRAHV